MLISKFVAAVMKTGDENFFAAVKIVLQKNRL